MITRGYFVGEIIDNLIDVSHQVDNRCKLGLTDINKYLEDVFKEVTNRILSINLINLNQNRNNEPGLDLGDESANIAFQVTSQKTSVKINETLKKITDEQLEKYSKIKVLVIGSKQKSYTLDEPLCSRCNFSAEDIWDISYLCKESIDLPLDVLQDLYNYVKSELVRVKIELEIPDEEGHYPTAIIDYIEKIPTPKLSDFRAYHDFHHKKRTEYGLSLEEVQKDFNIFSTNLTRLPRITREFYSFLLESKDSDLKNDVFGGRSSYRFNYDRLRRICRYSDIEGELNLLNEAEFIELNESDDVGESPYVRIYAPAESMNFIYELVEYIKAKKIRYHKPMVVLDFGDF